MKTAGLVRALWAGLLITCAVSNVLSAAGKELRASGNATSWKPHEVRQLNGRRQQKELPAQFQVVTEKWAEIALAPWMVYMPEKDRLLMLANRGRPHQAALTFSADRGATWSPPKYLHTDAAGKPDTGLGVGLTYLGNGKAQVFSGENSLWFSNDYGETWGDRTVMPLMAKGKVFNMWDPPLVDKDPKTGKVVRLVAAGWRQLRKWGQDIEGVYSQGYLRFSYDEGRTWEEEIKVPQWLGFNEVTFMRAKNGHIVAACRSDVPERLERTAMDNYSGMGISISKDNGRTWPEVKMLYEWGRHHPSLLLLPNGDIVMTYLVRRGYPNTPDGRSPQFGIEAVVSHDQGQTWDLDHRYLLTVYAGSTSAKGSEVYKGAPQCTTSVLLPDGSILTAFGMEYRRIGLVKWALNPRPTKGDNRISAAAYDSDLRNKFDPSPQKPRKTNLQGSNIAVAEEGAVVLSSPSLLDPKFLLFDQYLYTGFSTIYTALDTLPAWVEIRWPAKHRIDQIDIYGGDPHAASSPSTECVPLDYRLQYGKSGAWIDLIPPVANALRFSEFAKSGRPSLEFKYTHKFPPVSAQAIRLFITRTSDPGMRTETGDKVVVPEDKRQTVLRRIDVMEAE
jgi:hypothetical protein